MKKRNRIIVWIGLYIGCTTTVVAQEIARYDIIITEIMADPTPVVGLPAAEYIELHSRIGQPCTLTNWSITIGTAKKQLPTLHFDSLGYAVIVAQKNAALMQPFCHNLYTISSLSIADAGQTIILSNESNQVIHAVSFSKKWHTEVIKQEGGWSLELLDESVPCIGQENWNSSVADLGGTPGAPNASAQEIDDNEVPHAERLTLLNDSTIRIFFSESIVVEEPFPETLFNINPPIPITETSEVPPFFNAFDIHLANTLQPNVQYLLCVNEPISDCAGNETGLECLPVGCTSPPRAGDLVINEVLSHPFDGTDADFIEIYNRSSRIIDLKDIKIGSGGDTLPNKAVRAVASGRQLFPQQFCALCKDRTLTMRQYDIRQPLSLQACDSLPAYANGAGVVYISTIGLQTIDRFAYEESMHFSGLSSTEGVSLERLRIDEKTQDADNWHSASAVVGFATPGYENSQAGRELPKDEISLLPDVFTPNNDGFDDYTEIKLYFVENENRLTINIFNQEGRLVRHLVNNAPCGREALFRWDGTDDSRRLVATGAYIVVINWWNASGKTKRLKKVVGVKIS